MKLFRLDTIPGWAIAFAVLVASCAVSEFSNDPGNTNGDTNSSECAEPPCNDDACIDQDGDRFGENCAMGPDCDDTDAARAPVRSEICDGKDNDCDGLVDEELPGCDFDPNNGEGDCAADEDGDAYGEGCEPGGDCDEADPTRYEGAPEVCDGKDNDCDGETDEGFELGGECVSGLGVCEREGVMACSPDGSGTECGAMPGMPEDETCDRKDNDCNGMVDDGINCPACIEDPQEPDDRSINGTSLPSGSIDGVLCPDNVDWFQLGSYSAGQSVSVTAMFSHADGDIDMELYSGASYETGSYSGTDNESITHTITNGGTVAVRLFYQDGVTPQDAGVEYTVSR